MKDEVYNKLSAEVDIIINVAASVDFIARLDLNLRMNAVGALNVLKFAHKCPRLQAMCHVSTAYVNSDKP